MLHTKFRFIWRSGFSVEYFYKSTNQQKQSLLTYRDEMSNFMEDLPCMLPIKIVVRFDKAVSR